MKYLLILSSFLTAHALAQNNELGLLLGPVKPGPLRLRAPQITDIDFSSGLTFSVNYARRLAGGGLAALYLEFPFAATPQHKTSSVVRVIPRDVAALYFTPGLKIKFAPGGPVSPYLAGGGGYAQFEQSMEQLDGRPFTGPRRMHRSAYDYGGGVDIKLVPWIRLRGEVRDFVAANTGLGTVLETSRQHNVLWAGGLALTW